MAWLVTDGRVLASAEVVNGRRDRARGLIGRDGHEGALVLSPCRWIHTVGMRFPLDVAYVDAEGIVLKTVRMNRNRMGLPIPEGSDGDRGRGRGVRPLGPARRGPGRAAT